jgi:hypothetical protein
MKRCVCPTAGSVYCPPMQMADVFMSRTCTHMKRCVCPTEGSVYCPPMQMADVFMSRTCTHMKWCVCPTAGSVYRPPMQMADVLMSRTCTKSPKQHKLVTVLEFSLLGPQSGTVFCPPSYRTSECCQQ